MMGLLSKHLAETKYGIKTISYTVRTVRPSSGVMAIKNGGFMETGFPKKNLTNGLKRRH